MLSGFTGFCRSTLSSRRVPPVQFARPLRNHLSRGCADQVDWCHLLRISDSILVGRSRQERLFTVGGPSRSKESRVDAVAITSEPNWMHSRTAQWTIQNYRILALQSPPSGDRRCPSHLSPHVRSNIRGTTLTDNSDSQFPIPQRGRKRLSREVILHTELALEWPELVQIARCKVQWLPRTANKRILTSFLLKEDNIHNNVDNNDEDNEDSEMHQSFFMIVMVTSAMSIRWWRQCRGGQTFPKSMEIRNSVASRAFFSSFFPSVSVRGGRFGFRAASPMYWRTGRPILAE